MYVCVLRMIVPNSKLKKNIIIDGDNILKRYNYPFKNGDYKTQNL